MGEKVIIDWEQLGVEPPEGEKPAKPQEHPPEAALQPKPRDIEARYRGDATFLPEAHLAAERQAIDAKLQGLEEEAEDVAGGGLAAAERNARLEALERKIEDLGIEAAVLDEAIKELEAGRPEAALNYYSAREEEASAVMASAHDEMEAAVERLKDAAGDSEALVAAAAEVNEAKVALDAAERKRQRLADQLEYLKRQNTKAA